MRVDKAVRRVCVIGLFMFLLPGPLRADPCGLVPPIYPEKPAQPPLIARIGAQITYVFHLNGIETFVIRPGFQGRVDEFGMLIPFPTPPAIRKVADDIFPQIAAAIDPPEVTVDLRVPRGGGGGLGGGGGFGGGGGGFGGGLGFSIQKDEVKVIREEAIGMYEVAVLAAGSAEALKRWMADHRYRYPNGMEAVCQEFIEQRWCFVAVKTRVGRKGSVEPRPAMREAKTELPPDAVFDGNVQAMEFRFRVKELVVPMRLSAFNEGPLRNIVYLLTDRPQKVRDIPTEFVVRQIPGKELLENLTRPLPLRVLGGTVVRGKIANMPSGLSQSLKQARDPKPHNGVARELFADDLRAVRLNRLALPQEEAEKELLRISEHLRLRGPEIDKLHQHVLAAGHEQTTRTDLAQLTAMTLSVIDGDFPRDVLARDCLTFARYTIPSERNNAKGYDAKRQGPGEEKKGVLLSGGPFDTAQAVSQTDATEERQQSPACWLPLAMLCVLAGTLMLAPPQRWTRTRMLRSALLVALALWTCTGWASPEGNDVQVKTLIRRLAEPESSESAARKLIDHGEAAVPVLATVAARDVRIPLRGWAIVCLSEIGGDRARQGLVELGQNSRQPRLVQTWALAGRVQIAQSFDDLIDLAKQFRSDTALQRPLRLRTLEILKDESGQPTIEKSLELAERAPELQKTLTPAILGFGAERIAGVMFTSRDNERRRLAAGCLATLGQKDPDAVGGQVVQALRFRPDAAQLPWHDGALFVPSIRWTREPARELVRQLIAWMVWCDLRGDQAGERQIHNTLQSAELARVAGYESPGFKERDAAGWLETWAKAAGKGEVRAILQAQQAESSPKFRALLEQVP